MIIDVVDGSDPDLAKRGVADINAFYDNALIAPYDSLQGGRAIILQDRSLTALRSMVEAIIRRASRPGQIHLLRIHGHGNQASQLVGGWELFGIGPAISLSNLAFMRPTLRRLAPYFARSGRAQLMGCNVGQAPLGPMFLQGLADLWGVPVSAGKQLQYAGGDMTLEFEGPVETAYPRRQGSGWMDVSMG